MFVNNFKIYDDIQIVFYYSVYVVFGIEFWGIYFFIIVNYKNIIFKYFLNNFFYFVLKFFDVRYSIQILNFCKGCRGYIM